MYTRCVAGVWSDPVRVAVGYYASLASGPDGTLYLTTLGFDTSVRPQADRLVVLQTSSDDGVTWTAPVTIARAPQTIRHHGPRIVATPDGTLHALWRTKLDGGAFADAVEHAVSYDAGRTWTAPELIRPTFGDLVFAMEVVPDARGRLHLFQYESDWVDTPPAFRHQIWSGGVWSAAVTPFGNRPAASRRAPALAVDPSGRVHAAWTEYSPDATTTTTYYTSALLTSLGPAASPVAADSVPATPNPARDTTTLSFTLAAPGDVTVDLYAADGRLVESRRVGARPLGTHGERFSVSRLAPGVYTFSVRTPTERHTGRFTVVH